LRFRRVQASSDVLRREHGILQSGEPGRHSGACRAGVAAEHRPPGVQLASRPLGCGHSDGRRRRRVRVPVGDKADSCRQHRSGNSPGQRVGRIALPFWASGTASRNHGGGRRAVARVLPCVSGIARSRLLFQSHGGSLLRRLDAVGRARFRAGFHDADAYQRSGKPLRLQQYLRGYRIGAHREAVPLK
jgi:hypothetical protein